ncbi:MAG: SIMPL domain-containing protein, partial [Candidatus Micrarchaeota archaeon]
IESCGNDTPSTQAQSAKYTADVKAGLLSAGVEMDGISTGSYYTYPVYNESYTDDCYYYDYGYPYPADEKMMEPGMASDAVAVDAAVGTGMAYPDMMPMPPCRRYSEREIIGYKTVHELMVETSDTSNGGKIIDAALGASDAAKVGYVYFSLTESTRLEAESALQAQAAQAARVKAQNIASGLGANLGKIVSINPDYYYPYPMYAYKDYAGMADGVAESAAAPTEIFPTDTELWSYITVVYELEQ